MVDLPALPQGKVYQLWAIPEGQAPLDAGLFTLDAQGHGRGGLKALPDPTLPVRTFAITVEPAGGSPSPTSAILLAGNID